MLTHTAGGKEWKGNRLIWDIWNQDNADSKLSFSIKNLDYSGKDISITSFRIGPMEYLFFNKVPLSLFKDNISFFPYRIPYGARISLEFERTPDFDTQVWWTLGK